MTPDVCEKTGHRILGRVSLLDKQAEDAAKETMSALGVECDFFDKENISAQLHVFYLIVLHGIAAEWAHPLGCDDDHIYFLDSKSKERSIRVWLCADPDKDLSAIETVADYTVIVKHGMLGEHIPCFVVVGYFKGQDRTLRPLTLQSPNILFDTKAVSSVRKREGEADKPAEGKKRSRKPAKKDVADDPLGLF